MSNIHICQNKSQMSLQYPVTCCGAQCMRVTRWTSIKESTSDFWNINLVLAKFIDLLTPSTNCTGWHSIWSPGQTQVYIPDSRTSSHHYHPEYGDRGTFGKVRTLLTFWYSCMPEISLNFVTAEASRISIILLAKPRSSSWYLQVSPSKPCMDFSSPPHIPLGPPIS